MEEKRLFYGMVWISGCIDDDSLDGKCKEGSSPAIGDSTKCCLNSYPYYWSSDGRCHTSAPKHCTDNAYPLYCPVTGKCCPAGYAHLCDGKCYASDCPGGTVSASICSEGSHTVYNTTVVDGNNPPDDNNVVIIEDPPIDGRTGCPPQGYSGPRGGVNLQCSQWVDVGTCSIQSCACYYNDHTGNTLRAYYHTSDGAYFPCSGSREQISCVAAAQAIVARCGGKIPWALQ